MIIKIDELCAAQFARLTEFLGSPRNLITAPGETQFSAGQCSPGKKILPFAYIKQCSVGVNILTLNVVLDVADEFFFSNDKVTASDPNYTPGQPYRISRDYLVRLFDALDIYL